MKFAAGFRLTIMLLLSSFNLAHGRPTPAQNSNGTQHFICNTGYTLEKCHKDMAVLRKALEKYQASQRVGEWTWVLVRSEDWREILQPRGLNPDSPAFTYYAKRETFVEEALVTTVSQRSIALVLEWGMRIEDLLDFAVTHELGHALCNEKSEARTEFTARLLRTGRPPQCEATLRTKRKRNYEEPGAFNGHASFD